MGKNLKKVIFSVLLLAAVIVVSPKDAKAAGKVWMAGFNDNSITIQWTPQNSNVYRVDGYYLEKIGTQEIIWQGSADTTQVTVQATKGYSGYIRLGYRLTSLATGKKYNWSVDSVYVNTTPADVAKNLRLINLRWQQEYSWKYTMQRIKEYYLRHQHLWVMSL